MKRFASLLAFFGFCVVLLPTLVAQDGKDEPKPEEKKPEVKKKPIAKVDENIVIGAPTFLAKVKEVRGEDSAKEIILAKIDPEQYRTYQMWEQSQMQSVRSARNPNDAKSRMEKYKKDLPNKLDAVFVGEQVSVPAPETLRVRVENQPAFYDAAGVQRRPTAAELTKLKGGNTRLPGYLADLDAIRVNQLVMVYHPKSAPAAKKEAPAAPAKKFIGADQNLNVAGGSAARVDAYMILIKQD